MRMDKLTNKFQQALSDAQSLAVGRDHQFIEPVHVLAALLDQDGGTVRPLLAQADVNINLLRSHLGEALDRLPRVEGAGGDVQISNALSRLLNLTDKLAQQRKDAYISSELFVLAALEDKGELGTILHKAGATKSLIERGFLVRYFNLPRISDYIRITIGSEEDMAAFCAVCRELFATGK